MEYPVDFRIHAEYLDVPPEQPDVLYARGEDAPAARAHVLHARHIDDDLRGGPIDERVQNVAELHAAHRIDDAVEVEHGDLSLIADRSRLDPESGPRRIRLRRFEPARVARRPGGPSRPGPLERCGLPGCLLETASTFREGKRDVGDGLIDGRELHDDLLETEQLVYVVHLRGHPDEHDVPLPAAERFHSPREDAPAAARYVRHRREIDDDVPVSVLVDALEDSLELAGGRGIEVASHMEHDDAAVELL